MKKIKHYLNIKKCRAYPPLILWLIALTIFWYGAKSNSVHIELTALASDREAVQGQIDRSKELASANQNLKDKLEGKYKAVAPENIKELVRFYIRKNFPESEWATAEKVAFCESGMSPVSLNDKNTNGSADRGVWQINSVHAKRFEKMYGIKWEVGAHDIEMSTKYARFLWDHSRWNPWVCYRIVSN